MRDTCIITCVQFTIDIEIILTVSEDKCYGNKIINYLFIIFYVFQTKL
jgi:hypothetical protein